jgi:hypothetical protein
LTDSISPPDFIQPSSFSLLSEGSDRTFAQFGRFQTTALSASWT